MRYIDSTGLGVLIGGLKRVREHSGTVQSGLHATRRSRRSSTSPVSSKIFGIYDTEESGMREPLTCSRRPEQARRGVELHIPSRAEWVGVARLAVAGIAQPLEFSIEDVEDLKLAVAEACTNCIQHAARR